ncbi:hypothetical protein L0Y65_02155 [Candidatus Micrarchaeota archaeon]|nr:hypothetical protein [Candidatus Micrarchaeota archaeon]
MDRPDIEPEKNTRLVARTQSIEEAERIASQYELRGFTASVVKKSQAGLAMYEVWISRQPDVFSQKGFRPME